MDLRKVKKLIELVEESAIAELEVASGDESIRIVMSRGASAPDVITMPAPRLGLEPQLGSETQANAQLASGADAAQRQTPVPAPMAGTFYRAPHPEADPFVVLGQSVQAGDVLCIIESMKMMHEIRAGAAGIVAQIPFNNGQPINTGDVLFTLS